MKQKIKIIELFSGIGGFSKGLEQAGFEIEKQYSSEIDKHAIANYKYNYPNAEYIGSVVDIRPGDFRGIDIITFGSPCQDFSFYPCSLGVAFDFDLHVISDYFVSDQLFYPPNQLF